MEISQISFGTFKSTVNNILLKHTFIKKRYVLANQALFINSKIHKEIMRRTCLRTNIYVDRIAYNKQRYYYVSLTWKEKRPITDLKIRDVTTIKQAFWRKVKPLFSEKANLQTKITPVEKGNTLSDSEISSEVGKVISGDREIAKIFNDSFVNLVPSLKLSLK